MVAGAGAGDGDGGEGWRMKRKTSRRADFGGDAKFIVEVVSQFIAA